MMRLLSTYEMSVTFYEIALPFSVSYSFHIHLSQCPDLSSILSKPSNSYNFAHRSQYCTEQHLTVPIFLFTLHWKPQIIHYRWSLSYISLLYIGYYHEVLFACRY